MTFQFKKNVAKEIKSLEQQLAKKADPIAYLQLASIYNKEKQFAKAIEVLSRGARLYPNRMDFPYAIAKIRREEYYKSFSVPEGLEVISNIQRAIELENSKLASLFYALASFYFEIEASQKAREILEQAAMLSPNDFQIKDLLSKIPTKEQQSSEDIESLLKTIEQRKKPFVKVPEKIPAQTVDSDNLSPRDYAAIRKGHNFDFPSLVNKLSELNGFQFAIICDKEGDVVEDNARVEINKELYTRSLMEIYNEAVKSSLKSDIGVLDKCQLKGPQSTLFTANLNNHVLFLQLDKAVRFEMVKDRIDTIIESNRYRLEV